MVELIWLKITKDGSVSDISLVEEHPEKWGFGKAALIAAKKLKYVPQVNNGQAVAVPDVLYRYTFKTLNTGK